MSDAPPPPTKRRKSKFWLWLLTGLIAVVGAGGGGAVAGAKLLGKKRPAPAASAAAGEPVEELMSEAIPLGDIVVDVRSAQGTLHHLRVGVSVELRSGADVQAAKRFIPKGREVVIYYLRSKSFEALTGAGTFGAVVEDLSKQVISAFGAKNAKRILVTDYMAQ